ncbi:MAG: hypothetical protein PHQ36_01745 [Anaerolineales bacterium]|nr:hypothetical protein [Anaerolineales bacterium]
MTLKKTNSQPATRIQTGYFSTVGTMVAKRDLFVYLKKTYYGHPSDLAGKAQLRQSQPGRGLKNNLRMEKRLKRMMFDSSRYDAWHYRHFAETDIIKEAEYLIY